MNDLGRTKPSSPILTRMDVEEPGGYQNSSGGICHSPTASRTLWVTVEIPSVDASMP